MASFRIEIDQAEDGRFIAEIPDLTGVMTYGTSEADAVSKAQALALLVIAEDQKSQ